MIKIYEKDNKTHIDITKMIIISKDDESVALSVQDNMKRTSGNILYNDFVNLKHMKFWHKVKFIIMLLRK